VLRKSRYPFKFFTFLPVNDKEIPIEVSALLRITLPQDYKERLEVADSLWWFAWWECVGDECMIATLRRNGLFEEYTSDWVTFTAIMSLNPSLEEFNLGDSDREAEHLLLVKEDYCENDRDKLAYIVSVASFRNFLNELADALRRR